jgi:hypothetical protein
MITGELESSPVRRELLPGERLVWEGRPATGLRLGSGDVVMIPFSLMWGGFAFFWEATAIFAALHSPGPRVFMVLWGIPFCVVGAYLIIGRFFYDAYRRGRSFYGLSDRRVIIAERSGTTSLPLGTLPHVHLAESRQGDGEGTITFGTPTSPWGRNRPPRPPAFEFIADARGVQRRLEELRQSAPFASESEPRARDFT